MEHKIRILDEDVANVISAGEVVENPSAMIKELIENSLDAGANNIEIIVDKNGRYVKITDNGEGMGKEDLLLSVERHSTSKIRNKEDIYRLSTYGFRGEALASIASISRMEMLSKTEEMLSGNKIYLSSGSIYKTEEIAMNKGTSIEVYDLFFNTPARLKFMKSKNTEYAKIKDIVLKEALINFKTSFSLIIEGRKTIATSGKGIENTIFELFGKEVLKNIVPFEYGYLGNMEILKNNKDFIFTYFNKRYAKSYIVDKAVIDGYYTKLMKERYPFAIIIIDIDPYELDVNIHPSKKNVKFSDERKIYSMVKTSIENKFNKNELEIMPIMKFETPVMNNRETLFQKLENNQIRDSSEKYIVSEIKPVMTEKIPERVEEKKYIVQANDVRNDKKVEIENIDKYTAEKHDVKTIYPIEKVIGQLNNMYILVQGSGELVIYDQHIVHERVLYEQFKEKLLKNSYTKKPLLIPIRIQLGIVEKQIVEENKGIIEQFGFEIEEFDDGEILLRTVPDFEFRDSIKNIFKYVCEEITKNNDIIDIREKIIISMSCKGAIKAGEKLEMYEMEKMIKDLHFYQKYTCPHGRPIIIKIPFDDLDKKFGRKQ